MKNTMIFGTKAAKKLKNIRPSDSVPKLDGYNHHMTSNKKINDEFALKMMNEKIKAIKTDNQLALLGNERFSLENQELSFKNAAIDAATQAVKSSTRKMDAETVLLVGQYTVGLLGSLLAVYSSADIIAGVELPIEDVINITGTETTDAPTSNTTQRSTGTDVPQLAESNRYRYRLYLDKFRNLVENLSEPRK
jgi:hypothetical protein